MFDLSSTFLPRGTEGSNPSSSSEQSAANPESLDQAVLISGGPQVKRRRVPAHELQCVIQDGRKYVVELTKCIVQVASCKPIGSHPSTPSIRDGHIKGQ